MNTVLVVLVVGFVTCVGFSAVLVASLVAIAKQADIAAEQMLLDHPSDEEMREQLEAARRLYREEHIRRVYAEMIADLERHIAEQKRETDDE